MRIFVDTSAFYALLDRDDRNHQKEKKSWREILEGYSTVDDLAWSLISNPLSKQYFPAYDGRIGMYDPDCRADR